LKGDDDKEGQTTNQYFTFCKISGLDMVDYSQKRVI